MSSYILSICGAVIISALVTIILPEGKTGKFINGILKLTCVLIMLIPILSWVHGLKAGEGKSTYVQELSLDENYLNYFYDKQSESMSEEIKEYLEKELEISVFVEIEWQISDYAFTVKKVFVNIKNFGMNEKDAHIIIIEQIKAKVSEITGVDKEAVVVNE